MIPRVRLVGSEGAVPLAARRGRPEGAAHLVAVDVRGLGRLLDRHPELDHVQEELQQVLVLGVAALDGEGQVRLAVLRRESRGQRDPRLLAGRQRRCTGSPPRRARRLCRRWLRPMPVRPAMTAGFQAPLGVIETTQPSASAAITDVVPTWDGSSSGTEADGAVVLREPGLLAGHRVPRVEEGPERVGASLEGIGVAGPDVGVVPVRAHPGKALLRVLLREEARHRLLRGKGGVAVVEVAVGEGHAHGLVDGVDGARGVVAHRLQVHVLEDVEGLEHRRALGPDRELVDVDALVRGLDGLLELHLPAGEILLREEPALLLRAPDELLGDLAPIEAVVGRLERLLAALARLEGLLLRLDELSQGRREVLLDEHLAGHRRLAPLAGVGKEHRPGVGPAGEPLLLPLERVRELGLDRVAVGHLDRGLQDVLQAEPAVLGEHRDEAAGSPRRHGGERPVLRRVGEPLRLEESRRRPGRRHAERVDADHLLRARVVHERLGLPAPAERVPHRAGGREHGARGVHGVAALREHERAGGGGERLARDRHPVAAVEDGLHRARRLRVGGGHGQRAEERRGQENEGARSHVRPPDSIGWTRLPRPGPVGARVAGVSGRLLARLSTRQRMRSLRSARDAFMGGRIVRT